MNSIDLHTEVAAIVAIRWDDFAAAHPHLARIIDQHLLVESAVSHLRQDPDYQTALATARAAGAGMEVLLKLVDRYVSTWLARLV